MIVINVRLDNNLERIYIYIIQIGYIHTGIFIGNITFRKITLIYQLIVTFIKCRL